MENLTRNNTPISLKVSVHAWRKIEDVKKSIDTLNLNNDYQLTLGQIAQKHYMSKSMISKTFRLRFNISIHQYIIQLRMERAKFLLAGNSSLSICKVAETLGYSICSNFSRDFKKYTGMLPLELSKKANMAGNGVEEINSNPIV